MTSRWGGAVVLAVLLAVPPPASAGGFAIVIGNNAPESDDVPTLRYADDDAVATHALLVDAGVDSVLLTELDDDTRRLHADVRVDGPPSWEAVSAAFDTARTRLAKDDGGELWLFYSGHGDVDAGEGYLVLSDGRFTRTRLYDELLARSPAARNHVIVDACNSYFVAFEKGPGGSREAFRGAFAARSRSDNTGFVLSTSSERDSHEWERYQAGVFSHEVRSGLRGAADADADGSITYEELGAFLVTANEGIRNARLRPDFTVKPPAALSDAVITWTAGTASLRVDQAVGHVYVETADGVRVLDAHPAPDTELALRLPAARPLFLRTDDEGVEYVVVDGEPARVSALAPSQPRIARRGAQHLAFRALFETAFGGADVERYRARFAPLPSVAIAAEDPRRDAGAVRTVAGWLAVGGGVLGVAAAGYAWERQRAGEDASHRDRIDINRSIDRANKASVALFTIAAVAGVTWWALAPDDDESPRLQLAPSSGGLTVSVEARF